MSLPNVQTRSIIAALCLCLATLFAQSSYGASPWFTLPSDANVESVAAHGAKGDGTTDDTEAIRNAIKAAINRNTRYASPPFIYFPVGTYLVSGPLEGRVGTGGWSNGWRAGVIFMGEHRDSTIVKLKDSAPGYQDRKRPKWLFATGSEFDGKDKRQGGGNRAFRHSLMNMTIAIGKGNPGATAIDYVVSNRGAIKHVTIKAAPGSGYCGIRMDRSWPGPGLIKDVSIIGFDYSFRMHNHAQYSMTFEDLVIDSPRIVAGITSRNPFYIRNLKATLDVPLFKAEHQNHLLVLMNATIKKKTAPTDPSAPLAGTMIASKGAVYMRDITVTGYKTVVDNLNKNKKDLLAEGPATKISEYTQGPTMVSKGAKAKTLHLPVEETPEFFPSKNTAWASARMEGGLQAAIDSGAEIVYLPNGGYGLKEPLIVRGNVKRIIGMQSNLGYSKAQLKTIKAPAVRIEAMDHTVIFEHIWFNGHIEKHGKGGVAFKHCDLNQGYTATGPGKTFLEDVIGHYEIRDGHKLWARQTNAEFGNKPLVVNRNSTMWLFGYKTEGDAIVLNNIGGKTEILGALFYPLRKVGKGKALLQNDGGVISGNFVYNGNWYPIHGRYRQDTSQPWQTIAGGHIAPRGPALFRIGK